MRLTLSLLVLASGAALSPAASAQEASPLTTQGTHLIGGSADASVRSGVSSIRVSPRVGVFVIDNLALGVRADASYASVSDGRTDTALALVPFSTVYFGDPGDPVQPYATAAAGLRFRRVASDGFTSGTTEAITDVAAGALVQIGSNVGLTGEAYAELSNFRVDPVLGVRGGIAVFLGR